MVFYELSIGSIFITAIVVVITIIQRKSITAKFRKLTLIDKIIILALLSYALISAFITFCFIIIIPIISFLFLPPELLTFFNFIMVYACLIIAWIKWKYPLQKSRYPKVKTIKINELSLVSLLKSRNVEGSGEKSNPFIIKDSSLFSEEDNTHINRSSLYITFKDHAIVKKRFKRCTNLTFENCRGSYIHLVDCSEGTISNCELNSLNISRCVNIHVENSIIKACHITGSFLNTFNNCSISYFYKIHSPDNSFNLNQTLKDEGRKSNVFQNNIPSILILLLAAIIAGSIIYFTSITSFMDLNSLFVLFFCGMIFIFCVGLGIMAMIETISLNKKIKKYYHEKQLTSFNFKRAFLGWCLIVCFIVIFDLVYTWELFNIIIWSTAEQRTNFIIIVNLLSSFMLVIGVDQSFRSIQAFRKGLLDKSNAILIIFLYINLTFVILSGFTDFYNKLAYLYNGYIILRPLLIVFILFEYGISLIILLHYRKLKKAKQQGKYKIMFSAMLIIITYFLMTFTPIFSLNYQESLVFIVSVIFLGIIGLISFPNPFKAFKGARYMQKGKYNRSIKQFQSFLRQEPQNELGWHIQGINYLKLKEYAKAIEMFNKALQINAQNLESLLGIGFAAASIDDFTTALASCDLILNILKNPTTTTITKISDMIKSSIQLKNPLKEERVWHCYSYIYGCKKEYKKALECANKAVELNPSFKEAWTSLGASHLHLENYDAAMQAFNMALSIDSTYHLAWGYLGRTYFFKGDLEKAIALLERAVKMESNEYQLWYFLSEIQLKLKDYPKALKSVSTSLKLNSHFKEAQELRDKIYRKMVTEKKDSL